MVTPTNRLDSGQAFWLPSSGNLLFVERAPYREHAFPGDMGVNRCCLEAVVAEQFLDRPDVISFLQQGSPLDA